MMMKDLPQQPDSESLSQLSKEELVSIIVEQASRISEMQKTIEELRQEIIRLKVSRDLDSQTDIVTPIQRPAQKTRKKEIRRIPNTER